ncbi:hypothetical protein [Caulobacter sp. RL271]|uniref:Uncharacterized protein n=1 Tax=Caulobacter segnis TaxID=88688 RepID=A0ABY4ZSV0_9CAUL|nr:hypothetical protein [Caulobacter segnis]USQ95666.1 hypothetical protein MZV50_24505 [Caulobacter segnis]
MRGRIRFPGNPWPDGHPVAAFVLSAALDPRHGVGLLLHLESQAYDAEGPGVETDDDADWTSPDVWLNYGEATLSNTHWGYLEEQLIRLDQPPFRRFDPMALAGRTFAFDPVETLAPDWSPSDQPFQIYLLGHDAVAEHHIAFTAGAAPGLLDIVWRGRVALAYAGDEDFKHTFEAQLRDVPFSHIELDTDADIAPARREAAAQALLGKFVAHPDAWRFVAGASQADKDRFVPA